MTPGMCWLGHRTGDRGCFFFSSHGARRDLHSFPTRRSSDLRCPQAGGQFPEQVEPDGDEDEHDRGDGAPAEAAEGADREEDRKSTRLNSSHITISYAVFCLKKKKPNPHRTSPTRPKPNTVGT